MLRAALLSLALLGSAGASPAAASEYLGDLDVTGLSLKVNGRGEALISYRKTNGARRDVLVRGAMNAHAPDTRAVTGEVRAGLQRRLANARQRRVCPVVPEHVPRVRRSRARPARRRLQGSRRLLLGAAALAAARADARLRPVPPAAVGRRAPCLALVGTAARARGFAELDVWRHPAGSVRPSHVPRRARVRVPDTVRDEERPIRPVRLHRHLQLRLRPRLETRYGHRHASAQRSLLLQLRRPSAAARLPVERTTRPGQRRAAPRDGRWGRE